MRSESNSGRHNGKFVILITCMVYWENGLFFPSIGVSWGTEFEEDGTQAESNSARFEINQ